MKRVLFLTNAPAPYQLEFFSEFKAHVELKVVFFSPKIENNPWAGRDESHYVTLSNAKDWVTLKTLISEFNPDVCIFGGYKDHLIVRAKILCLVSNIKVCHWLERPLPSSGVKAALKYSIMRVFLAFSDAVFAIGQDAEAMYAHMAKQVFNIPYSIDSSSYRIREWKDSSVVRFLFVGQLIERKGVDRLLKAFHSFHEDKASLTIVGTGPLSDVVRRLSHQQKNISKLDYQKPKDMKGLFANYDVFILPSVHDGWGVVVSEAMAAGLPVIGTPACGAVKDLVIAGHNGIQCNGDVASLTEAMQFYIDEPHLIDEQGANARYVQMSSNADARQASSEMAKRINQLYALT